MPGTASIAAERQSEMDQRRRNRRRYQLAAAAFILIVVLAGAVVVTVQTTTAADRTERLALSGDIAGKAERLREGAASSKRPRCTGAASSKFRSYAPSARSNRPTLAIAVSICSADRSPLAGNTSGAMARPRSTPFSTATELPVGEVGRHVGFPDAGYFARIFGKVHGASPARWRRAGTDPTTGQHDRNRNAART